MHARIYVENYSREEGNELTLPRNYYGPDFATSASAVPAIMASRRRGAGALRKLHRAVTNVKRDFNFFKLVLAAGLVKLAVSECLRTAFIALMRLHDLNPGT